MADTESKKQGWTIVSQNYQKAAEHVAVVSNAFEVEDEFKDFYAIQDGRPQIIQPPYDLKVLERIAQENNTLPVCIDAMVANIDGTGYDFEGPERDPRDEDEEETDTEQVDAEDPVIKELQETFSTIGIDESFVTLRKKKRYDEESTGNAYFEFLRNLEDEIIFIRHVESKMMRLVKLDEPVTVTKSVTRNGRTFEVEVPVRERRYAQLVGGKTLVYFREFGSSRHLHKKTGEWETQDKPIDVKDRASEVMHFRAKPDAHTPYGIPRWISQLPSILGSRKAEEFNLEFFNNGGVPPAIIFLQGGTLTPETRKSLDDLNVGAAVKKNRIAVLEMESIDGSLDKGGANARATVERFGADRQADSMFETYDDKTSLRVRRAFRLAPLFMGQSDDYNFATSHTSYMVTEQQVFKPERDEFDEIMSIRVLPSMGHVGYRLVSKPLVLKNAEVMFQGVDTAANIGGVSNESLIETINDAAGTRFEYDPDHDASSDIESDVQDQPFPSKGGGLTVVNGGKPDNQTLQASFNKSDEIDGLYEFSFSLRDAIESKDKDSIQEHFQKMTQYTPSEQKVVRECLSKMVYQTDDLDDLGLAELAGCGQMILAREALSGD